MTYKESIQLLQRDGARLVKTAHDDGITRWGIYPFGLTVTQQTAAKILRRSDVYGCQDGLLPDCHQTFAMRL
jgi:hypothetical protein